MDKRMVHLTYGLGIAFSVVFLGLSIYDAVNKDWEIDGTVWIPIMTIVLGGIFGGAVGWRVVRRGDNGNGNGNGGRQR